MRQVAGDLYAYELLRKEIQDIPHYSYEEKYSGTDREQSEWQDHQPEISESPVADHIPVIDCVPKPSVRPADSLAEESAQSFRRGCVDYRFWRVRDQISGLLNPEGHFHVFRRMRVAPSAEFAHNGCAEERERSGRNENRSERSEYEPVENAQTIFDVLHVLEYSPRFVHMDTRRDCRNIRIPENRRNAQKRFRFDD